MSNKIVWFNVGVGNAHWSIWQTCICDGNFSPESFRFESCKWDENGENPETIWVTREELNHTLPRETLRAFENIDELLIEVEDACLCRHDVGFRGAVIHVYDIFDMDDTNEWGYGKPLWD